MPPVKDPETSKFVSADKAAAPADKKAATDDQPISTPALTELSKRFLGEEPTDTPPKPTEKKPDEVPPKKPVAKKPAAAPAPTATEIALQRTTDALEKVVERVTAKPAEDQNKDKDTPDPLEHLSASERRKVNVLKQMEKDYADRPEYKGIADKFVSERKEFKKYLADWQTKHPGETFDENADEHEPFFAAHNVDWDDDDYIESLTNMKAGATYEEREKKLNSKLSEVERQQKAIQEQPKIAAEGISAARTFWKAFGEDLAEVLSPTGAADLAKLTELQKSNPVKYRVAVNAAQKVEGLTGDMYRLLNGLEIFNKENATHAHLVDFALAKEKSLMARPLEDRQDAEGRDFKPRAAYRTLPPEEQKKYWTFNATDFGYLIAAEEASRATAYLEQRDKEFREEAAARGIKLEEPTANQAKTGAGATGKSANDNLNDDDEPTDEDEGKPRSPASVPQPKVAANQRKAAAGTDAPLESFMKRFIG